MKCGQGNQGVTIPSNFSLELHSVFPEEDISIHFHSFGRVPSALGLPVCVCRFHLREIIAATATLGEGGPPFLYFRACVTIPSSEIFDYECPWRCGLVEVSHFHRMELL